MTRRTIQGLVLQAFSPSFYRVVGLPIGIHCVGPRAWFISEYNRGPNGDITERCHKRPFKSLEDAVRTLRKSLEQRDIL